MPESRLEEPLFCLDMDAEVRIKGCGTTWDVTEARADIQSWALAYGGAAWRAEGGGRREAARGIGSSNSRTRRRRALLDVPCYTFAPYQPSARTHTESAPHRSSSISLPGSAAHPAPALLHGRCVVKGAESAPGPADPPSVAVFTFIPIRTNRSLSRASAEGSVADGVWSALSSVAAVALLAHPWPFPSALLRLST